MNAKVISFSGVDGSGKTIMAGRVFDYLRTKGLKAEKFKAYEKSIFFNIGRLLGKISHAKKRELDSRFKPDSGKEGANFSLLRRICLNIDIALFRLKLLKAENHGIILVCDRYLYDTLIHLRYLDAVDREQYSTFLKKIPRPDLALLLFLDADSAKDREGKHDDLGYYKSKGNLYKELAAEIGLITIDTSYEIERVWEKIKNIIDSTSKII